MTRAEQIEQEALNYGHNNPYCYWNDDDLYEEDYESPSQDFKAGAEWADRTMFDNICEWLENTFHDRSHHSGRGDAGEIVTYDFDSMQEFISKFAKQWRNDNES